MNSSALAAGSPLPPHASRPSLFAAPGALGVSGAGLADPADAQRILTCLLPQPAAKRAPIRLRWVGAGVMALTLLGALYEVMHSTSRERPAPSEAIVKRALQPMATTSARAAADAEASVALPTQAARIESSALPAAPSASNPFHELDQGAASMPMPPAERRSASVKSGDRVPARAASPIAKRQEDSDVDLLEAIMARVSGSPAAPAGKREPRH